MVLARELQRILSYTVQSLSFEKDLLSENNIIFYVDDQGILPSRLCLLNSNINERYTAKCYTMQ